MHCMRRSNVVTYTRANVSTSEQMNLLAMAAESAAAVPSGGGANVPRASNNGVGYYPMNDGGVHRIHWQLVIPSEDSDFVLNCATDLEARPSILHRFSYVVQTLPLSPCFTTSWCRQGMRPKFRWAASQRGTGRCGSTMTVSPIFEPAWAWVMVRPKHGNPGTRLTGTR